MAKKCKYCGEFMPEDVVISLSAKKEEWGNELNQWAISGSITGLVFLIGGLALFFYLRYYGNRGYVNLPDWWILASSVMVAGTSFCLVSASLIYILKIAFFPTQKS